jgi:heme/copper-type cytochrome/quinol oxidase subunit 2
LTWEFPPNLPPVFNQSIIFNGVVEVIGANDRNWIFDFKENSNYTIDLLATNVIGTNSIRLFSYRQLIIIPVIYYSIGMFVLLGISVILIIILIVVTSYLVYNKYKQKKSNEERENAVPLK